jgi:hypothetical protein
MSSLEVLVPPFCKYHFEKDLEMTTLDEAEERRRRRHRSSAE